MVITGRINSVTRKNPHCSISHLLCIHFVCHCSSFVFLQLGLFQRFSARCIQLLRDRRRWYQSRVLAMQLPDRWYDHDVSLHWCLVQINQRMPLQQLLWCVRMWQCLALLQTKMLLLQMLSVRKYLHNSRYCVLWSRAKHGRFSFWVSEMWRWYDKNQCCV